MRGAGQGIRGEGREVFRPFFLWGGVKIFEKTPKKNLLFGLPVPQIAGVFTYNCPTKARLASKWKLALFLSQFFIRTILGKYASKRHINFAASNPNRMKKLFTAVLTLVAAVAMAQPQMENQGFENWENLTTNNREPLEWNSIKTGGGNASTPNGFVVDRSTTVRPGSTGTYSAMLETKNFFVVITNVTVNGVITNGRVEAPTFSAADGYIRSKVDDQNFYTSFNQRPDSIVVWANYQPSGNDQGSFEVILHDIQGTGLTSGTMGTLPESGSQQGNNTPQVIARASHNFSASTGGWVRIAVPFVYVDARTPQYILMTATSSGQSGAVVGSKLYLDDIELIYHIAPTPSAYTAYVTASNGYPLNVNFTTNGTPLASTTFTAQLSDASGSFANPTVIGSVTTSANNGTINCTIPAGTVAGTGYLVRVVNASPYYRSLTEGIEVINPTVSIAPATTQNLTMNEAGNPIDIDATLAYLGMEWLFATSPGGPYASFVPAETGMNYTPMFANAGTYYVVAQVNYGPFSLTSNEVMVVVSPTIGINGHSGVELMTYANDQLVIDLTSTKGNALLNITSLDGRLIQSLSLRSGEVTKVSMAQKGLFVAQLRYGNGGATVLKFAAR